MRERVLGLRAFVMCLRHRNHGPTSATAQFFTRSISECSAPEWPSVLWVSQHLLDPRSPAMSRGHQIDTLQDDRGLAACLSGSNVLPEWADAVIRAHKWETLEDFIFSVDEKDVTAAIHSLLAPTPFKDNRLTQARLRAAYSAGAEAIKQAAQAAKSSEGVDDPLPESTMEQLNRDFRSKYALIVEATLEPSDALRARVYREFRKRTMSVVPASRIKSVLHQATPRQQDAVKLGEGIQLEFHTEEARSIRTVVDYYWSLRTLAYAWAWAGLHQQRGHDGKETVFISLTAALNYADHALSSAMEFGQGSRLWLERNDLLTRTKMASYIRQGYNGWEALQEALRETHLEWRASAIQAVPNEPAGAPKRAAPGASEAVPPAPKRRQIKQDSYQTISMLKGGLKLCKPWNDGRGCANKKCPQVHKCDVKLPTGKPCQGPHTRLEHPSK